MPEAPAPDNWFAPLEDSESSRSRHPSGAAVPDGAGGFQSRLVTEVPVSPEGESIQQTGALTEIGENVVALRRSGDLV